MTRVLSFCQPVAVFVCTYFIGLTTREKKQILNHIDFTLVCQLHHNAFCHPSALHPNRLRLLHLEYQCLNHVRYPKQNRKQCRLQQHLHRWNLYKISKYEVAARFRSRFVRRVLGFLDLFRNDCGNARCFRGNNEK